MLARDIMTKTLITVCLHDPLSRIAQALLRARVGAVPVIDGAGRPVGVVSEWDLIGQHAPERIARRDHWLSRLAEGQSLAPDYVEMVEPNARTAAEVMTSPVITVAEDADLVEIAGVLSTRKVRRVFVVAGDRLTGVVSRADLARALMLQAIRAPERAPLEDLPPPPPPEASPPAPPPDPSLSATAFRRLVEAHEDAARATHIDEKRAAEAARRKLVEKLSQTRLTEKDWADLLQRARAAAERGEKDFLLMRFPSSLCSDGGRRINVPDPDWPTTLRGPAADIFEHWRDELRPAGFGLVARILEFPGGFPGDVGMTLTWSA